MNIYRDEKGNMECTSPYINFNIWFPETITLDGEFSTDSLNVIISHMKKFEDEIEIPAERLEILE